MLYWEEYKRDWRCIVGLIGTLGYRKREREFRFNVLVVLEVFCRIFVSILSEMGDV